MQLKGALKGLLTALKKSYVMVKLLSMQLLKIAVTTGSYLWGDPTVWVMEPLTNASSAQLVLAN